MNIIGSNRFFCGYNFQGKEDPIVTLTKFADHSPGNQVQKIQIYSHNKVVLTLEGNQEVTVHSYDLDLPNVSNEKLIEYLTHSHIVITQFDDESYKITTMQGLPAGAPKPMPPNPSAPYFSTNSSYPNNQMQQYAQPSMNPGTLYSQGGYGNQYNSLNGRVGYPPPSYPNQPAPYQPQQAYSPGSGNPTAYANNNNSNSQSSNVSQSGPSSTKQDRQIDQDLRKACQENGNLELVKSYLRDGADINSTSDYGWTPLHIAALYGHVDIVEYLVSQGARLDVFHKSGRTPLGEALMCNSESHFKIAEILIQKGPNKIGDKLVLDSESINRKLRIALTEKNFGRAKQFIVVGADIENIDDEGRTLLAAAVYWGDSIEVVNFLLQNSAKIDPINNEGMTPLAIACDKLSSEKSKIPLINILLRGGADVSKILPSIYEKLPADIKHILYLHIEQNKGRPSAVAAPASSAISPLNEACKSGNVDAVRQAISNGHRPDTRTLTMACWSRNLQIVEAVLAVDAKHDDKTLTTACSTGMPEIVRKVRAAGAEPTKETYDIAQQVGNHILNLLPRKKD